MLHLELETTLLKNLKSVAHSVLAPRLIDILRNSKLHSWVKSLEKRKAVSLDSIFGFDFYQNNKDIIDYTEFNGLSVDQVRKVDPEYNLMATHIREGSVAIDIGANIGFYTLGMTRLVGRLGVVYAFEPGPISFALLSRNINANLDKLESNVVLENMAVSDRAGESNLFINLSGESDNQVHHDIDEYSFKREDARPKVSINITDLDAYPLKEDVSFIKVDTQGHEYYVLQGAKKLLTEAKNIVLLLEYAPYLKAWDSFSQDDFYNLIKSMGYLIYDVKKASVSVDSEYLKRCYGKHLDGKWTSLLLRKP